MNYVIANEGIMEFGKQFQASYFTGDEGADLLEHKDTIIKLLEHRFFNYQLDYINGKLKGKEEKIEYMASIIVDLKNDLENLDKSVKDYHKKEREKQA